ncbi:MAG TPA: HDOD domain-containing protein, partial [Longimicrobiales bacterium]|nr:HDOD domain-containing protein [Longimicrobiales bacterium]
VLFVPSLDDDDAPALTACRNLLGLGFELATDAMPSTDEARQLDVVGTVRIDVSKTDGRLADIAAGLRERGIRLMADGVKNREERERLLPLGFELFHGFGSSRQESISRKDLSVDYLNTIRLMQEIQEMDIPDSQIEARFRADVALSYKLLRIVNSAAIGGRGIDSIGHAIRLIGRGPLYRWLGLLLVSSGLDGGVQAEVLHTALLRARLSEMLATPGRRPDAADTLYMVGLLSPLDILIGASMDELLPNMGLSEEVQGALADRAGFHGTVLRLVEAYDLGYFDEFEARCEDLELSPGEVASLYLEALTWANAHAPALDE